MQGEGPKDLLRNVDSVEGDYVGSDLNFHLKKLDPFFKSKKTHSF